MGKKDRKDARVDTSSAAPLSGSPFGALADLAAPPDEVRSRAENEPEGSHADSTPSSPPAPPRRAVVRYQRSGRGGSEVTLVEKLELGSEELATWLRELKKKLGCGGFLEGSSLVFNGDQRKRLPALLETRGVKTISVS